MASYDNSSTRGIVLAGFFLMASLISILEGDVIISMIDVVCASLSVILSDIDDLRRDLREKDAMTHDSKGNETKKGGGQ